MASTYVITNCCVCGSAIYSVYKEVDGIPVLKCNKCKLKWIKDIDKNVIASFYGEKYFNSSDSKIGYKNYLSDEKNHRKNSVNIFKTVSEVKDLRRGRVLDVGCAFGFLLDEARRLLLCDVDGVEISKYASEYARSCLDLNVINRELESCEFQADSFDAVFMMGTIEHSISPKSMLHYIHGILKPEGILVITTIDTKGLVPLYSIKPPEHLFYFNHHNIRLLLNGSGYKVLLRRPYFAKYQIHDLFHRLSLYSSLSVFDFFYRITKKYSPDISIKIPTNEMLVIAKKDTIS